MRAAIQEASVKSTAIPTKQRGVDLAVPVPLPDELARGLKGRLMRLNGIGREEQANDLVLQMCSHGVDRNSIASRTDVLADAFGLSRIQFVCQHTMLPLRRAIAFRGAGTLHGSDADRGWRVPYLLAPDRAGAYFCNQCVEEDLDFHGVAYWRRDHQLPGRYCCGKHAEPLMCSSAVDPLLLSPAQLASTARPVRKGWARRAEQNGAVQRFLFLQSELLSRPAPLDARGITALLREKCLKHGLHVGKGKWKQKKLLSEELVETYGKEWLSTIVRDFAIRVDGELFRSVDNVNASLSGGVVLAAFAMLADDGHSVLAELLAAGERRDSPPGSSQPKRADAETWRRLYIRHEGCHNRVASELGKFPSYAKHNLDRMGLPTLGGHNIDQVDRLLQDFVVRGRSMAEACESDPALAENLERLLRKTAMNLASAVRQMQVAKSRSPRGKQKPPQD